LATKSENETEKLLQYLQNAKDICDISQKAMQVCNKQGKKDFEKDEEITLKDCLQPLLSSFTYSGCWSIAAPRNCKMYKM
jgi:hypothetical protein